MTIPKYDPSKMTVYVLFEDEGNHEIFYDRNSRRDGSAIPFVYLKEAIEVAGYNFKPTTDYTGLGSKTDVAYILSLTMWNHQIFQSIEKHPKEKCLLFNIGSQLTHGNVYDLLRLADYFGKIFVIYDDMVDNKRFFKFHYPQRNEEFAKDIPEFEQKRMCSMVQSNRWVENLKGEYGERLKAAAFFSTTGEFDLYGPNWHGFSAWKGTFRSGKKEILKNYKFCLAYENMKDQQGYITDRLFDALYAKCIPIYLGASNITNYVPKECFINRRDFSSYEDLYSFMKSLDKKSYESYLQAAQAFLKSPEAEVFSTKHFARTVIEQIAQV